ncbi:hypothetical protein SAMN02910275_02943 [Butyrivibrio sp. INlla18]|uniref:glycosyltransferase family 1 protein n=1 Tax=Butyrivibrio sp. INlla18 TaxID=1520806 RepID=UPI00089102FD|nr:glycosyltransferase family 1 protein [Butyrivibrio sp. INlla18]SDA79179.1 hypothetical protein SAMN02910275_02943 [Butyrivibrio sp. INlla18]
MNSIKKSNPHLLIAYAGKTTTADITIRLMKQYALKNDVELKTIEGIDVDRSDIAWCDCVLIIRGADCFLSRISAAAKKAGKCCVFYIDDDLLALYGENDVYHKYLLDCLHYASILWTSNINVSKKYSAFLRNDAKVVEAIVLDPWEGMNSYRDSEDEIGIIFAGSPSHEKNISRYILPAINDIYYKQRKKVCFHLIGFQDSKLRDSEPYIKVTRWFDNAEEYRRYVATINAQIGLAVIEDTEFGRCKFYNKYLEYSKLGLMGIYTDCEPFTFAVKDKFNGLLAENTVEDWTNKLLTAIDNPELRKECVTNAQRDLDLHYSTSAIIETIEEKLPELKNYRSEERPVIYSRRGTQILARINTLLNILANPEILEKRLEDGKSLPRPAKVICRQLTTTRQYKLKVANNFRIMSLCFAKDNDVKGEITICLCNAGGEIVGVRTINFDDTISNNVTEIQFDKEIDCKEKLTMSIDVSYENAGFFGVFEKKNLNNYVCRGLEKLNIKVTGKNIIWYRTL